MNELVRAHATYRFILCDEEDEKPRLLVRLDYVGSHQRAHKDPHSSGYSSPACGWLMPPLRML